MPPTVLYIVGIVLVLWASMEFTIWRMGVLRKRKLELLEMQMEYARLEDKALRAQMDPHFIFNSLNSIKLLVQENENEKAIYYLTTFTKLLRGLLQNADKPTIRLYDELETCKMYLELESLRFNDSFGYRIDVPAELDLKTIEVPGLILQPFVENAIWHGLMPKKGKRELNISINSDGSWVTCLVDDNGIGRKAAMQKKEVNGTHVSKGMQLTGERMKLNEKLYDTMSQLVIRDKYDPQGEALGTQVELKIAINV